MKNLNQVISIIINNRSLAENNAQNMRRLDGLESIAFMNKEQYENFVWKILDEYE